MIDILLRFLLVVLNIDAILGETSVARRKEMLQRVATTGVDLDNVYDQTLRRIKEQKGDRSRLGMEVLMWVSHAERPLRIDELCHALATEMGATDHNPENIRSQDTVLRSCFGLAVVDKETSTVRLIHYTLQEYLSRPSTLPDAHRTLGQTCLTFLNYHQVKRLPTDNVSTLGYMPFLEYSSLHWGRHAKIELSDHAKLLALDLLSRYDSHIASTLLFDKIRGYRSSELTHRLFTGLHCASYFGIDVMVAALIKVQGSGINQGECRGVTPLILAAQEGHQGAVSLLLARDGINPEKPDSNGGTPLWWASRNGHEGVVRLLLARDDVNPDKPDNNGGTPLWWASRNGHEGVVRLLLARDDVNPDKPDNSGQTPLWWASLSGYEGVVGLLLARDGINPDKPDNSGRTPLWGASFYGHEGVVRLLLARDDVNPDKPANDGKTPLWAASSHGHEGVARILLSRGAINPDQPDNNSPTPLPCAPSHEHEEVVRPPTSQDNITPDEPVKPDQAPPKTSRVRRYSQITAQHTPRLRRKKRKQT